jgi:hypothetical protein
MALNSKIAATSQTTGLNAYSGAVGELLNLGTLKIRTGAPPTNTTDADSGKLLATLGFSDPAFLPAVAGESTATTIIGSDAVAAGDAGHFRAKATDGTVILQVTVGEAAETPDLTLDEKTTAIGEGLAITVFSFEIGA